MKLITINNYLLLIDEEAEIKENELGWDGEYFAYFRSRWQEKDWQKVIGYYPLASEAAPLNGIPLLPNPFKDEDTIAANNSESLKGDFAPGEYQVRRSYFLKGFNKARETKQFSLEDMKKAITLARTGYGRDGNIDIEAHLINGAIYNYDNEYVFKTEGEIIKSLSVQLLPKEFIPEYSRYIPNNELDMITPVYKYELKTITNQQGQLELVGEYKY